MTPSDATTRGSGASGISASATAPASPIDSTRSACGALKDGIGVCRDFTHLAVALCGCLDIPARYCTGYLGDIGVPPVPYPMHFSAWFEVWIGGRWYAFDARHNTPRIGRILMATWPGRHRGGAVD